MTHEEKARATAEDRWGKLELKYKAELAAAKQETRMAQENAAEFRTCVDELTEELATMRRDLILTQQSLDGACTERNFTMTHLNTAKQEIERLRKALVEIRDAWAETNISFKSNVLDWYPKLHAALESGVEATGQES